MSGTARTHAVDYPSRGTACFLHAKHFPGIEALKPDFVTPDKTAPTASVIILQT